jgi:hypothetical protein
MTIYYVIIGEEPVLVTAARHLPEVFGQLWPDRPEDMLTIYEQRRTELHALILETAEVSRDDAFAYLKTTMRGWADPAPAATIDWDRPL